MKLLSCLRRQKRFSNLHSSKFLFICNNLTVKKYTISDLNSTLKKKKKKDIFCRILKYLKRLSIKEFFYAKREAIPIWYVKESTNFLNRIKILDSFLSLFEADTEHFLTERVIKNLQLYWKYNILNLFTVYDLQKNIL